MCMGIVIAGSPNSAYKVAVFILSISLLFYSIRQLTYYIRMARQMVGGRAILYRAIITFDLAVFTRSLTDVPAVYVMLYLIILHLITGGIGIMGALEAKSEGGHWKLSLARSMVDVLIAVLCMIFIRSIAIATVIYGIGLIYTGVMRIIGAFRRNAIVFIQ